MNKESDYYYVVATSNDGRDPYAVRFRTEERAKYFLWIDQHDFRKKELLTESVFFYRWTMPNDYFFDEKEAEGYGYFWNDKIGRWAKIHIKEESDVFDVLGQMV